MKRWIALFLSLGLSALPVFAQSVSSTADDASLARLERGRMDEDDCVVVSHTGQFRLERRFPNEVRVYEGAVSAGELQDLVNILDNKDLKRISSEDIPHPLIRESGDIFVMQIFRPAGVQQLLFPDSASRKRFADVVEPAMSWLEMLRKAKHTQLPEAARNGCQPHAVAPRAASPAIPSSFLVIFSKDHISGTLADRSCVIVYGNGKFHREKSQQRFRGEKSIGGIDAQLDETQIAELRTLLNGPELTQSKRQDQYGQLPFSVPNFPESLARFREAETTSVVIPRADRIQHLRFLNSFGVLVSPSEIGGLSGNNTRIDHDERVLDPLKKWLGRNVESQRIIHLSPGTETNCAPQSSEGSNSASR